MRCAGYLLLMFLVGGAARAADSIDLMGALGPDYAFDAGKLKVELFPDEKVWLNGKRWPTHDDDASVHLTPGNVLITASPEKWYDEGKPTAYPVGDIYLYRLEQLDAKHALFTLTTYDEVETTISPTSKRYSLGRQRVSTTFTADLTQPHGTLVDYGPNHVELGLGLPSSSKLSR